MKTLFIFLISLLVASADAIKSDSQIVITIKGVPPEDANDLSGPYSVYGDGTINLPMIKTVKASGKTPAQLAKHIESIYKIKKIYTNPTINVSYEAATEIDSKIVTFITEHGSKNVPYMKGMNLVTAIAAAGGPSTFDSKRYAYVERNQKSQKYDLKDIEHRNTAIIPNDVIRLPHVNEGGILGKLFGTD